ncbi:hypothetical protein ACFCWD_29015 [Streptomyces sp. NPDC056374]|uniref:hypothetical protein n=1 Tax=unclassified Streptomyces TaxID=2593676 RepID=UPI0035DD39B2
MSIDWGDAPTWIAAVFAGLAAGFTGWTLVSQRQQIDEQRDFIGQQSSNLRLERAELLAAAEDRRMGQARAAHLVFDVVGQGNDGAGRPTTYDHWRVVFTNGSNEPFRDVMVRFGQAYIGVGAVENQAVYLPDQGRRTLPVDLLGSYRSLTVESPRWPEATVDNNPPAVYFTDSNGQRWMLDRHGILTPQAVESAPGDAAG